jgi:hypothetical protein
MVPFRSYLARPKSIGEVALVKRKDGLLEDSEGRATLSPARLTSRAVVGGARLAPVQGGPFRGLFSGARLHRIVDNAALRCS